MTPPDNLRALAELQRLLEKYGQISVQELMARLERAELALAAAQQTPQEPCNCRMGMPPIGAVAEAP